MDFSDVDDYDSPQILERGNHDSPQILGQSFLVIMVIHRSSVVAIMTLYRFEDVADHKSPEICLHYLGITIYFCER